MENKLSFKFIDLFAGIGGFHHALSSIGGECVLTCEFDKECEKTYKSSFPGAGDAYKFVSNIRELTRNKIEDEGSLRSSDEIANLVPDHDILCGGFPCQPFSKSGGQKGVKDKTRGTLFFDILQIIEAKKPKYIFLENVRNIAGPRHLDTWKIVIESLRQQGYRVSDEALVFSPHLLSPTMGGAPQVRERVFIVGVRENNYSGNIEDVFLFNKKLREGGFWDSEKWRVSDILVPDHEINNLDNYSVSRDEEAYLEAWDYFVENIPCEKLPGFPIWAFAFCDNASVDDSVPDWKRNFLIKNSAFYVEFRDFIDGFMLRRWGPEGRRVLDFPYSRQILEWQARRRHPSRVGRTLKDLVIQFRPSGIRVKPPTYLPALVAITQTSVVGPHLRRGAKVFRKLTPVEAGRLQGIPDYVFSSGATPDRHAYKQLGNAVNVGVVRATAEVLMGLKCYGRSENIGQIGLFEPLVPFRPRPEKLPAMLT